MFVFPRLLVLVTEKKWLIVFACEECGFVETYVSETASLQ